ncbi:MAG TPA: HlyD family secretion protein [Longimicrobiales bacterium]|nr:HlyD family secretion protein [Longimicrobiales bacterium]
MSEEKQDEGQGQGRRPLTLVVVAVVVVAALVWGFERWRFSRAHVSTDNAQVDGHIVPLLAKVGGYIQEVRVEENQHVTRGELVVVVDPTELDVRLAEAEADVAAARAAAGGDGIAGQVEADAAATRARRQALEERLNAARAQRDRAAKDLARAQELADKQIASRQQLDAAQAAADAAAADLAALEQDVAAARAAERGAGASGRAADARLARAEAQLRQAKLNLEYARVQAPISGVVSKAQVEVGQLIQPGQPLGAVVSDSAVWVTANLKETELADVREGQAVHLDVDAYPGCDAEGTVESLSPATGAKFALIPPDNATGNFTKVVQRVPVRVAVVSGCGEGRPLRPGMSVNVHISVR